MPENTPDVIREPFVPALSATSDLPAIKTIGTEKPAETPAEPAPESKPDGETAEAKPEGAESAPAETEAKPESVDKKPQKGISERFSQLSEQRRAAESRADKLAESLEKALGAIDKLTAKPQADQIAKESAEDPRPKRDTFTDPDTYDTALVEWSARQATRVASAQFAQEAERKAAEDAEKTKKANEEKSQKEQQERAVQEWNAKLTKAKSEMPDYDDVVLRDDLPLSIPMAHAIMASDIGPQVAYFLGKNPEEAARIAAINNPVRQAIEIGKIEAKLLQPKPNVSKAPEPIKPLGSKAAATPKTPEEESMAEYAARRMGEIRRGRGGLSQGTSTTQ